MALTLNGDTGVSLIQDNVVTTADVQDNAVSSDKLADSLTLQSITETQTTKSASFTPSMTAEGTVYSCTAAIEIYVFYSDGTNWYGMQSGTGFA